MRRPLWICGGLALLLAIASPFLYVLWPSSLPDVRPPGLRLEYSARLQTTSGEREIELVLSQAGCTYRTSSEPSTAKGFVFPLESGHFDQLWQHLRRQRIDRISGGKEMPGERVSLAWDGRRLDAPPGGAGVSWVWESEWRHVTASLLLIADAEVRRRRIEVPVRFGPGLTGTFFSVTADGIPLFDNIPQVPDGYLFEPRAVLQVLPGASRVAVRWLVRFDPAHLGPYGPDDFATFERLVELEAGRALRIDGAGMTLSIETTPPPVEAREPEPRLTAVERAIAAEHAAHGEALDRGGLHRTALRQFERALARDPDHASARARLGFERTESGWRPDPRAEVERTDAGDVEERNAALAALSPRDRAVSVRAVDSYREVARVAQDALRADLFGRAWRRLLEYEPDDAEARKALGFTGSAGQWLRPAERARRGEFAEARRQAEGRDPSRHFAITGGSAVPEQGVVALAVRDLFHRWFEVPPERELFPTPMRFEMSGSQAEWDGYLESAYPREQWDYVKRAFGSVLLYQDGPRVVAKTFAADTAWKLDLTAHDVAHALLTYHQGGKEAPLWLHEGIAYVFQLGFLGHANSYCIPGAPTSENPTWDLAPPEQWRGLLRASVVDGTSPPIRELVSARLESMSSAARIKTSSLLEWMLAERRAELRDLLARLARGEEHDAAVKAAFRIADLDDLDQGWREWVAENL